MLKGLVIGTATSTVKHSSMQRQCLLVVQPQLVDGKPDGDPLLAVDIVGAGVTGTLPKFRYCLLGDYDEGTTLAPLPIHPAHGCFHLRFKICRVR